MDFTFFNNYNNNNNNNNNKCKDNKTNNGEDHNDQTYTQRLCEYIQLRLRILLNEFKD